MTLVNNFCCADKKNPKREKDKKRNPRSVSRKKAAPPIKGKPSPPFECMEPCNKLGYFATTDWAFDQVFRSLPGSNTTCRCRNAKRMDQPFIQQGRSCKCLIRPKKRLDGSRPDSCGCNNRVPRQPQQNTGCCKIKPETKKCPYLTPKDHRIIQKRCNCH